jgi:hypothetical protein
MVFMCYQVAVLPYAGDRGVADEVLKCLAKGVRPRELAALAAETLALSHAQEEDGFGPSFQSQDAPAGGKSLARRKRGALSATAAASRELMIAALLRTPPEKVS